MAWGSMMDAPVQVSFNRSYFDAFYSDWITHRSKWRRYAVPFAFAITLASIAVLWFLPDRWFFDEDKPGQRPAATEMARLSRTVYNGRR